MSEQAATMSVSDAIAAADAEFSPAPAEAQEAPKESKAEKAEDVSPLAEGKEEQEAEAKGEASKPNESGEDDSESGEKEEPKAKFERKLKVNGREITVTSEEEYDKYAQMGASANERWEEAAEIRNLAKNMLTGLRDPGTGLETARRIGIPIDELLEQRFQELYQEHQMTPEQKALHQREQELKRREKEWQRRQEMEQEAVREKEVQRFQAEIPKQLDEAITGLGLPDTKAVRLRILEVSRTLSNPDANFVMPLGHAAQFVKQELTSLYGDRPAAAAEQPKEEPKERKRSGPAKGSGKPAERVKLRIGSQADFDEDIKRLFG